MDQQTEIELQAAAFRRLQKHLMEDRTDVQNIDLMNMAGFCRNCLSRWYQEAANERGIEMDKNEAREIYYGMTMVSGSPSTRPRPARKNRPSSKSPSRKTSQTRPDPWRIALPLSPSAHRGCSPLSITPAARIP